MYSRSYPRNRNPISSKPRSRCRGDHNKRARRHPWYTSSTCRSRASERDRRFFPTVDPAKEKDRIQPTVEDNENDQPQVKKINLNSKLCVTDVDLHIGENAKAHHTNAYQCSDVLTRDREKDGSPKKAELVIRRGQEFKITITFNRPYDVKKNDIVLLFNLGDDYKPKKQLSATFRVDEIGDTSYKPRKWGATVDCKEGNKLTLLVFVPANVAIGEWELSIKTIVDIVGGKDIVWQYNHTADYINIIFNPWCKEDLVYMEDEDWRNETVLNTCGAQYNGSCRKVSCRSWNFGQFDDGILDTALHLVRKGFGYKACSAMASPAKVARILSSIVNSPGDDGVLCGNWSGTYTGGVKPTA